MEKVGLQRNLASHLGLRSQCQRKKMIDFEGFQSHIKLSKLFFGLLAPSGPKRGEKLQHRETLFSFNI
jgi:hypothetical protein